MVLTAFRMRIPRVDHPTVPKPETVNEILVLKFLGMGSILQATPLFQALRQRFPAARITLLTFQANAGLRQFALGVDEFVTVDPANMRSFLASNVKAWWRLRQTRFDLLLNLEFFATYATLLTWSLHKRFAMGFGGFAPYREKFFHDFVSYDNGQHIQEKFLSFARRLGYDGTTPPLAKLYTGQAARITSEVGKRLGFALDPNHYHILVNINTGDMAPRRRWPVEHYREVVENLLLHPGVRCILIGGPVDREAVDRFQATLSQPDRVINLAGRISLRDLVALMEVSNLYLGNDSGPMHFAACVGLPILALFGPESPRVYGPPVSTRNTVLYRAEPCGPCLNIYSDKHSKCQDNICLRRIQPREVLDVLDSRYLKGKAVGAADRVPLSVVAEPVGAI
jgi:ADP-heptose:LPS heptosyltransferase